MVILFRRSKQLSSVYGFLCSPEGKIMKNLHDLSCSGAAMNRLKRGRRYTDTTVVRILDLHFLISLHLSWRKKIEIFGDGNFRFPFFYIFFFLFLCIARILLVDTRINNQPFLSWEREERREESLKKNRRWIGLKELLIFVISLYCENFIDLNIETIEIM